METRYRITARVLRDGQPFTTEPEFGATEPEARARLAGWIADCGWTFIAWHDLFEVTDDPGQGIRSREMNAEPRGGMADKMQQFVPGIVPGQREFFHVAASGTVERYWLVPGAQSSNIRGPATDHPLGIGAEPGWYDSSGNKLSRDPREVAP